MLNPGPGFRRIPCPACKSGKIRLASGTRQFRCSHCDFRTRDEADLKLPDGVRLAIVDFTPFARTDNHGGQP